MELILSALAGLPEFSTLASLLTAGETAALSGVGQLPRSHFLAGLTRAVSRPALILCPDDQSAQKCQLELAAFLGAAPALLPSREFTFCEAAVVSRGWEQRRLHLLWKLGKGQIPIVVSSLEALSLRTMPPAVLFSAAVTLRPGASFDLEDLSRRLTAAGYARTSLVEGVGQFSIRGGILDVFSPAYDSPLRAEFWGDEIDLLTFFDPLSQRRTTELPEAVLLPVAETLPHLHPEGTAGLIGQIQKLLEKQRRRKTPHQLLISTLESDLEKLQNGVPFPGGGSLPLPHLPRLRHRRKLPSRRGHAPLLRPWLHRPCRQDPPGALWDGAGHLPSGRRPGRGAVRLYRRLGSPPGRSHRPPGGVPR